MGTWSVNPSEGVSINQETGEITFPVNRTDNPSKEYEISYTENGCVATATYNAPYCSTPAPTDCTFTINLDRAGAKLVWTHMDGEREITDKEETLPANKLTSTFTAVDRDKETVYITYPNNPCVMVKHKIDVGSLYYVNYYAIDCGGSANAETDLCCKSKFRCIYTLKGLNKVPFVNGVYVPTEFNLYFSHTKIDSCSTNVVHSTPCVKIENKGPRNIPTFTYRINENNTDSMSSSCNPPEYNRTGGFDFVATPTAEITIYNTNYEVSNIQEKAHKDGDNYVIGELIYKDEDKHKHPCNTVSTFSYGSTHNNLKFVEDGTQQPTNGREIYRNYRSENKVDGENYLRLYAHIYLSPSDNSLRYDLEFDGMNYLRND